MKNMNKYENCLLCQRKCGINRRTGQTGVCGVSSEIKVARAALHYWEEPCISGKRGSGAVFFSGCSLHCVFCQNREISDGKAGKLISKERLSDIFMELADKGANNINLVTPGQYIPDIVWAVNDAKSRGMKLPIIYNTSGYENVTEDTLLSAMERAGNEELTEDTEKKGLGTPATRAAIIEKLIQSGFVKREKKNLVPTDDGNVLITVLPDEIKSPKMTAEWEMALNHIAQNTETADEFLNGITELMQELVARYQGISEEKKEQFQGKAKGEVIGKCPRCGADVREGKVNFYCSDRNCAFALWKNDKFLASQGKKMDKAAAKKFLSKGKIHYKDLLSRKTGRQYEATVEMVDPGEGNVQFNLSFPQR